ncbi:folylpolyglutamate synthase/dihydrofolate synthase family protein [soil metagenome]
MKDYTAVLEYLYGALPMFQRIGAAAYKDNLTNTIKLCEAIGNPQHRFKTIHVAGTNGKGSSSHMLAAIFQSAGYKTGLYTSPHLKAFTERIKIDGKEIDQRSVVDFVNEIQPVIDEIHPSFFEVTVAMAFQYFANEKVDIAVIEVGLGGRLDSTNVITPELSLITNISYDHKNLLGDTLEKIAFEKAGIIKPRIPVVVSQRQAEVENVFLKKASVEYSEIVFASDLIVLEDSGTLMKVHIADKLWISLEPELMGEYQRKNIPGVLISILELRKLGWNVSDKAIKDGIAKVVRLTGLKGRWQKLGENPLVICDTGHNPDGIKQVVHQIRSTPHEQLHVVLGAVNDKEISDILSLLPKEATYYFCQAKIPRALDAISLAEQAKRFGLHGKVISDVNEAYHEALRSAKKNDMIFIGGSTFVVGEINEL